MLCLDGPAKKLAQIHTVPSQKPRAQSKLLTWFKYRKSKFGSVKKFAQFNDGSREPFQGIRTLPPLPPPLQTCYLLLNLERKKERKK